MLWTECEIKRDDNKTRDDAVRYALALMRNRLDVEAPTNRAVIESYIAELECDGARRETPTAVGAESTAGPTSLPTPSPEGLIQLVEKWRAGVVYDGQEQTAGFRRGLRHCANELEALISQAPERKIP